MFAVEMFNITKTFGEKVIANDSVNIKIRKGEIRALVGENGAGKTTLMKILYGMHQPDAGRILLDGKEENINSPSKAIKLGIGMVHQHFMLVNPLSVLENVILGNELTANFDLLSYKKGSEKIKQIAELYNISIDIDTKIEQLPVGIQQRVEILKLLYRDAEIMILDEPTAVLTPQEVDSLFNSLRELRSKGRTIILITHKLDEVIDISDNITVMKQGKITGSLETKLTSKEEIAKLMIGEEFIPETIKKSEPRSNPVLEIINISVLDDRKSAAIKELSFTLHSGEILGIAGVEGNGQTELSEALSGLREIQSGNIKINGINISRYQNIAHIPADRQKYALVKEFSICDNLILGREKEKKFSTLIRLNEKSIRAYAKEIVSRFEILPDDINQILSTLSGGNQQKVVLGRELDKNTDVMIVSNPTRGLDFKATGFVHSVLLHEREIGKGVLLISSDLSELFKLSDRIAVLYKGRISVILDTKKTNEREIGMFMTGAL